MKCFDCGKRITPPTPSYVAIRDDKRVTVCFDCDYQRSKHEVTC